MKVRFRSLDGPRDWGWVTSRVTLLQTADTRGIVAVDDGDDILAVVVFDSWTHTAVRVHPVIESKMVLRNGFLEACADYVFTLCGRRVALGMIPDNRPAAVRFGRRLGFTTHCVIPDAVNDGIGLVVMSLRRENCTFWHPRPVAATG